MFVIAGPDHAIVQHDESVAWFGVLTVGTHGADHHEQVIEPICGEFGGKPVGFVPCGLAEGAAEGQILDRIAGQGHFREHDHLGVLRCGQMRVVHDLVGVGVKVSYAGVDLSEGETNVSHTCLVYCAVRIVHANGAHMA